MPKLSDLWEVDKPKKESKVKFIPKIKQKIKNIPEIKQKVPNGYILKKIPQNLDDLRIGELRTIYASMFGKEPPHDSIHDKVWIANEIKRVLNEKGE